MSGESNDDGFEWAMVEIYGHRRHAGRIREEERFGAKMMRIDVPIVEVQPAVEGQERPIVEITGYVTHWYGGSSIFSLTPTDEATAIRQCAPYSRPSRYIAPPEEDKVYF